MRFNLTETFLQEADELLSDIEEAALSLNAGGPAGETVNRLFRAFHTIKGSGAMCGLDGVAAFTHHVENLLDTVRSGGASVSPQLVDIILKSRDHIRLLLSAETGGTAPDHGAGETLVASIEELTGRGACAGPERSAEDEQPGEDANEPRRWRICFRPNPSLLAFGGNPVALFKDLARLGPCRVTAHTDRVPPLENIEPDVCYLWWTVELESAADENAIRDVFLFVDDGSNVDVESAEPGPGRKPQMPAASPDGAASNRAQSATGKLAAESTVRVPAGRLDRLVNLVGELVMNQSRLAQAAAQSGAEFANPVQELERLIAELRDNVLGIRMLPIGTLFGRFRRLVHDLSAELGKEAELVTEGAETELDKSILDQLGEPLVHCLRNCLDHAIEPAAERLEKGKPARGTILLSAVHTGPNVILSIQDDGRGIDHEAVRAKAVEKGLIAPEANPSERDILNLILMPGFSTARQITSVSGRGVGMDAVKRQIDALRGSLSLSSEAGKGTRVSVTLPLTLAIIDGLLVEIGRDPFIFPMAAVTENVELARSAKAGNNGRNVIAVRGELVPYIDLRNTFSIHGDRPPIEKVVIVQQEGDRVGLVVDRVLGTHQTVIQSVGKLFRKVEVVSGATVMGDGRVALILDVAALVRFADAQSRVAVREMFTGAAIPPSAGAEMCAL